MYIMYCVVYIEDDTCPGRPKTSFTKANIAAEKIMVEQDARLSKI